jgi:hypothetical protein
MQTSVKWNNYYGYSCNDGVKTALQKKKTGNVARGNLMLSCYSTLIGFSYKSDFSEYTIKWDCIVSLLNNTIYCSKWPKSNNLQVLLILSIPNAQRFNWLGRLRKDGTG